MKVLVSRCPLEEVMQILSGRWPTLLLLSAAEGRGGLAISAGTTRQFLTRDVDA
jgi:DNA-binding HxlR family transcriptional regulator